MAAHLAGAARDMAPDAFRAALGDAIGRGDGTPGQRGMGVVEAGATADARLVLEGAAGALPAGLPAGVSLAREMLPPPSDPAIDVRAEYFDPGGMLRARRAAAARTWPAADRERSATAPSAPRHALEIAPRADKWDVWATPEQAAAANDGSSEPPAFEEVVIEDEMLAAGADSSSLRRLPAGKEYQLKGTSQNTPFRPGGFEALSGIDLDPERSAAEAEKSLALLDFAPDNLLSVPPGFDPSLCDFSRVFGAIDGGAGEESEAARAARLAKLEPEPEPEPAAGEGAEELRVDASDGNAYTLASFYEAYGAEQGQFLWDAAEPAPAAASMPPPAPAPAPAPPQPEGVKVDLRSVFVDDDDSDGGWSSEDEPEPAPAAAPAPAPQEPAAPEPEAAEAAKAGDEKEPAALNDEEELEAVLSQMAAFHKKEKEKATEAEAETTVWATAGGADMSNFRELVPEMAIEYPFE